MLKSEAAGLLLYISRNRKISMMNMKSPPILFCSQPTRPHCQFLNVSQDMNQTELYMLYPLFQNLIQNYSTDRYTEIEAITKSHIYGDGNDK